MAGRIRRRPVVGADHALLAELLQVVVAGAALAAAVDQAAHADDIADLEAADRIAHRADVADDFVARHAGIQGARPFRPHGVQVGVADAAVGDVDLHVVRPGARRSMAIASTGLSAAWAP
jgi:hypothetical protein